MTIVRHDPFTRGGFQRECVPNPIPRKTCGWCVNTPRRLYRYVWVSDDTNEPSIFDRHQAEHGFCNFGCFSSYYC
jgi:hypothetical protein